MQQHVGVFLKGFFGGILVILRTNGKYYASCLKLQTPTLYITVYPAVTQLPKLYAAYTVISYHTAPKGIVEIQHKTLFHPSVRRLHYVKYRLCDLGKSIGIYRHTRIIVKSHIAKDFSAEPRLYVIKTHKIHTFSMARCLRQ